mgnify:CR=1 FL=1
MANPDPDPDAASTTDAAMYDQMLKDRRSRRAARRTASSDPAPQAPVEADDTQEQPSAAAPPPTAKAAATRMLPAAEEAAAKPFAAGDAAADPCSPFAPCTKCWEFCCNSYCRQQPQSIPPPGAEDEETSDEAATPAAMDRDGPSASPRRLSGRSESEESIAAMSPPQLVKALSPASLGRRIDNTMHDD